MQERQWWGAVAAMAAMVAGGMWVGAGCNGTPSGPGTVTSGPVLPDADVQAMEIGAQTYLAALEGQSAESARAALVSGLEANEAVDAAGLAEDGRSVWVQFADGQFAAIHTGDDADDALTMPFRRVQASADVTSSANASAFPARTMRPLAPVLPVTDEHRHSPISKQVLMMSPAAEDYAGVDAAAFDALRSQLMNENGWEAGDITIKMNQEADAYATLGLNDMIDLADYGVIVLLAKSALIDPAVYGKASNTPKPEYLYVQYSAAGPFFEPDGTLVNDIDPLTDINVAQALADARILRVLHVNPALSAPRWYLYLREDLWQVYLPSLPNSLLYLGISDSDRLASVFGLMGSGSTMTWRGAVRQQYVLDNLQVLQLMASEGMEDRDAVASMMAVPVALFDLYARWEDGALYLPTWINCQTRNCPGRTVSSAVEVSYTDPDVPLPAFPRVQDVPHVGHEVADLIAGQEVTLLAEALDVDENVLEEVETTFPLEVGANNVIVYMTEYTMSLTPSASSVLPGETITLTATCTSLAGDPMPDKEITFATDFGTLVGANPVTTGADGVASIELTSSTEGRAQVSAEVEEDDKRAVRNVKFGSATTYYLTITGVPDYPSPECAFSFQEVRFDFAINGAPCHSEWFPYIKIGGTRQVSGCYGQAVLGDEIRITITPEEDPDDPYDATPFAQRPLWLHYCPIDDVLGIDKDAVQSVLIFDDAGGADDYLYGTISATVVLE